MKIFSIGQRGVPHLGVKTGQNVEQRAWALAQEYAVRGHEVTYFGTSGFLPVRGGIYQGVFLKKVASLNPQQPGGLLYLLFSLLEALRQQPEMLHAHGWLAIRFGWLMKLALPATHVVLTVDEIPQSRRLATVAAKLADSLFTITVPSRELQYKLLVWFGIHAQHVPDGFTLSAVPDVPLSYWKLKEKGYVVVLAESAKTARQVIKQIKGREKIVLLQEPAQQWKRLNNEFARVKCLGELSGRSKQSVLNGAARVILADKSTDNRTVLAIMAAEVPVLAVPSAHYQEVLGTTARFSHAKDLGEVLTENASVVTKRAKAAAKRANLHFTWERSTADHLQLAAPNRVLVPVDSVQPGLAEEWQRRVLWA